MSTAPITVEMSSAEGALVIEALAARPFREVFALIGELLAQANRQAAEPRRFLLAPFDLALAVQALGAMPADCAWPLVQSLNRQIRQQMARPAGAG